MNKSVSVEDAEKVAKSIGLDLATAKFSTENFRYGMEVEYEHGSQDPETNVTDDDPIITGKIAWAHLKEYPDYYDRLKKMEAQAEAFWEKT